MTPLAIGVAVAAAAVVVVLDVGVFDDSDGPLAKSMLVQVAVAAMAARKVRRWRARGPVRWRCVARRKNGGRGENRGMMAADVNLAADKLDTKGGVTLEWGARGDEGREGGKGGWGKGEEGRGKVGGGRGKGGRGKEGKEEEQ